MPERGFIYILMNPSYSGLLKVGRTARDPDQRAAELSRVTGVPTPFVLAFKRFFEDSESAESFVHTLLETRGYRLTPDREFFRAPLDEAIHAILTAPGGRDNGVDLPDDDDNLFSPGAPDNFLDGLTIRGKPPWEAVLEEARAYHRGEGTHLQDYREAERLYKQAMRLGAVDAYFYLGVLSLETEKSVAGKEKALEYLKEGARRGSAVCWARMALVYVEDSHIPNALKCWDQYFASLPVDFVGSGWAFWYFHSCVTYGWPLTHRERLVAILPELREDLKEYVATLGGVNPVSRPEAELIEREFNRQFGTGAQKDAEKPPLFSRLFGGRKAR